MKTKEKAKELFNKYYLLIDIKNYENTKNCALIAVDEILFALKYDMNEPTSASIKYWQEVKKKIENL